MSDQYEDDWVDDYMDVSEGEAEFFEEDDAFDEFDDEDDFDDFEDDFMEEDEFEDDFDDAYDDFDEYDAYDEFDAFGDMGIEGEEALEEAMAYALGAEDTDEFFKKLWRGIKKVGRRVFRVAKRFVPRITKMLPGPWGMLASTGMRLLSRLRYEGASDDEAMEAFAELAAYDEAAVPVVSALAVRSLGKNKVKRLPKSVRKKMVKDISRAAKQLIRKSGSKKSMRAIPVLVKKVKRRAVSRPIPVTSKVKAAKKTIAKVANNKRLTRKLARKTQKVVRAKKMIRKAVAGRRLPA